MIAEFFRLTNIDLHSAFNDGFEKQYRQKIKLKPLKHKPAIVREIREYCVTLKDAERRICKYLMHIINLVDHNFN